MVAKLLSFYLLAVAGLGAVQAAPLEKRQDAADGALSIPPSVLKLGEGAVSPVIQTIGSKVGSELLNLTSSLFDREAPLEKRQDTAEGALSIPPSVLKLGEGAVSPVIQTIGSKVGSEFLNLTSSLFDREEPLDKRQDDVGALAIPKPAISAGKDFGTGVIKPFIQSVASPLIDDAVNFTKSIFKREEPVVLDKRNGTLTDIGETIASSFDHPIETLGKVGSGLLDGALGVASVIDGSE